MILSDYSLMKAPTLTTVVDGRNKTLYIPVSLSVLVPEWYLEKCNMISAFYSALAKKQWGNWDPAWQEAVGFHLYQNRRNKSDIS